MRINEYNRFLVKSWLVSVDLLVIVVVINKKNCLVYVCYNYFCKVILSIKIVLFYREVFD